MNPCDVVLDYHERTKHHLHRYARALGYLDWDTQPDPFRRFVGAPLISLPLPKEDNTPFYNQIYQQDSIPPKPVSLETISEFFFYSLAISAWKSFEHSSWALRVNPSSGNLHPTEGYLALQAMNGLHDRPGVYHYAPKEHGLERRTDFSEALWSRLTENLPEGSFLVGLSSIHWRESWKYGERAFRYCQHDVGHALAALRISAALLGWKMVLLSDITDEEIGQLLGLNRAGAYNKDEEEIPDLLVAVVPSRILPNPSSKISKEVFAEVGRGTWMGKPNALSNDHVPWQIITAVEDACKKNRVSLPAMNPAKVDEVFESRAMSSQAGKIIRQRRSAQSMDGKTYISKKQFYAILSRVLPHLTSMPWDCIFWQPFIHLGLFVHRVEGLSPGLYALIRDRAQSQKLKMQMKPQFIWKNAPECPEELPLFLLEEGDVKSIASSVSCGQDIAGDGVFSLAMLAEFEPILQKFGASFYRNLFWETGIMGQVLYLEAEAAGIRSTGIGCFFDDSVHQVFGIQGHAFQSLYHFTVGGPVEDPRLTTLPAYAFLK